MHGQTPPQCKFPAGRAPVLRVRCSSQTAHLPFIRTLTDKTWNKTDCSLHLSASTRGKELFTVLSCQSPPDHQLTPEDSSVISLSDAQYPARLRRWPRGLVAPSGGWRQLGQSFAPQHEELIFQPARGSQRPQAKQGCPAPEGRGCLATALAHPVPDRALPRARTRLQPSCWCNGCQHLRALTGPNDPDEHHRGPPCPTPGPGPLSSPAWGRLSQPRWCCRTPASSPAPA